MVTKHARRKPPPPEAPAVDDRDITINLGDPTTVLPAIRRLDHTLATLITQVGDLMAVSTAVANHVAALRANIARLTALIADILSRPSGPTPEDLAELAAVEAELDAVGASVPPPTI